MFLWFYQKYNSKNNFLINSNVAQIFLGALYIINCIFILILYVVISIIYNLWFSDTARQNGSVKSSPKKEKHKYI